MAAPIIFPHSSGPDNGNAGKARDAQAARRSQAAEEILTELSASLPPIPTDAASAAASREVLNSAAFLMKDPLNKAIVDTIAVICGSKEEGYQQSRLSKMLGLSPLPPYALRREVVETFAALHTEQILGRLDILADAGLIQHHHYESGASARPKYPWPGASSGDRGYALTEKMRDYLH
jgi:hypothetical protein